MAKRIFRSQRDKKLAGVCGGIAEYFNIDPVIVRALWLIFVFAVGTGILAYLICWFVIPEHP